MIVNKFNFSVEGLNLPERCPVCGGDLEVQENGQVKCINENCSQKVSHKISKLFEKLEIKGAGPAFFDNASKEVSSFYDFLSKATTSDVETCKWAGGVNGTKISEKLSKALKKEISIAKYISCFDAEAVGEGQIEKIVKAHPEYTLQDFMELQDSKMLLCEGVKETLAEKIFEGLKVISPEMQECLKFFNITAKREEKSGKLSGLSFCFTGKAEAIGSRKQCEELVVQNGGTISSVKKGLDFLVTDDTESGSSKNKKAKELSIKIITSYEFKKMID